MKKKLTEYLSEYNLSKPKIGLILGSGLNDFANHLTNKICIPYTEIENMPLSSAPGHAGNFVFGKIGRVDVLVMQGRIHYYEGRSLRDCVAPIKMMKAVGVENLVVTNAAGGINTDFQVGDLMLIKDHINFTGSNPLIGEIDHEMPRFPDMSYAYHPSLSELMKKTAERNCIKLQEGVYIGCTGPSYETPSEIKAFRILGADAVGMSTVAEVIYANALKMRVVGVSCISNMAAGILDQCLSEEEVLETGKRVSDIFTTLISKYLIEVGEGDY